MCMSFEDFDIEIWNSDQGSHYESHLFITVLGRREIKF